MTTTSGPAPARGRGDGYGVIPPTKKVPALAGYGAVTIKNALMSAITTLREQLPRRLLPRRFMTPCSPSSCSERIRRATGGDERSARWYVTPC